MRDDPGTTTTPTPSYSAGAHRLSGDALSGRPILLATDGSPGANAAARVTAALAAQRHAVPRALRVWDLTAYPLPTPLPGIVVAADALVGPEVHAASEEELRAEIAQLIGTKPEWPVSLTIGHPARLILEEATHLGAGLVVMGIRRHDFVERVLRDETTL